MMRRVLVVDDDPHFSNVVREYLTGQGFEVVLARDRESALAQLARSRPDVVLLDLMLGEDDGFVLGREIHREAIPFVIVSGRQEAMDRVAGLEMGADDFVTKPFELRELLARIRAVLRRASAPPLDTTVFLDASQAVYFEGWCLDLMAFELTDPGGDVVDLTSAELMLLAAFARHPGRVLTRGQISEEVLHKEWESGDRSVDALVSRLRNKIEPDSENPTFIKTRRGLGYVFALRVSTEP